MPTLLIFRTYEVDQYGGHCYLERGFVPKASHFATFGEMPEQAQIVSWTMLRCQMNDSVAVVDGTGGAAGDREQ